MKTSTIVVSALGRMPNDQPVIAHSPNSGVVNHLFEISFKRGPSQKELASILQVTTRQLRRWEAAEEADQHPCSRPYTHVDLWRLFQHRGRKGWDRFTAERLGLLEVFERFEEIGRKTQEPKDESSTVAEMMLRCIAADSESESVPAMFEVGLARAAKTQLSAILESPQATGVLVKAFFEAALIAEGETRAARR